MTQRRSYDLTDLPDRFRNIIKYATHQIRKFGDAILLPDFSFDLVQLIYSVDFEDEVKNSAARDIRNAKYGIAEGSKEYFDRQLSLIENNQEEFVQSLYAQGLVYLWAALESYIKQLCSALINFDMGILGDEVFDSIKIPMSEFFSLNDADRGMFLTNLVVANLSSGKKPKYGIDKFEQYLEAFGLNGSLNDNDKKNILTLHCFRNCIVHNDSVVDERFVEHCGWLQYKLGDGIVIKDDDFRAYESSVLVYIHEIYYRLHMNLGAPESTLKLIREELDKVIMRHKNA